MFKISNSSQNDENLNKAYSVQDNEGYKQDVLGVSEHDYSDHSHITIYDDDGRCSFDVDDDGNITHIHETSNDNQDEHEDDYPDCHINDFYQ